MRASDRYLWTMPADSANPFDTGAWKQVGNQPAIPFGNRENQITSLPGGGLLLLSAAQDGTVRTTYADTAEGLATAAPERLIYAPVDTLNPALPANPRELSYVYGPEVVNTVMNPDGSRTVTFNVSQWIHTHDVPNAMDHEMYRTVQYQVTVR